jgi:membrane protein
MSMWDLGGLSVRELLQRTIRESWEDEVFGQAGRLAFYYFIALFPMLLLLLMPLAMLAHTMLAHTGAAMRDLLSGSFQRFLPQSAALLVTGAIRDLDVNARAGGALLIVAALSAIWAGTNASWAMIVGLNTAYETKEDRDWRQIIKAAAALAFAVFAVVFAGLLVAYYVGMTLERGAPARALIRITEWGAISGILLISFALFYRFGPNLKNRQWQWSTPGAVFGATLWIAATLLFREWFDRFSSYPRIYGRAAAAAMLLMWMYMASATVLLGAELNSEIEKASEGRSEPPWPRRTEARRKGTDPAQN